MKPNSKHNLFSEMDSLRTIVEESFNADIMNPSRKRNVVDARMSFAKILRDRGHTYTNIGEYMSKDHSTIIHYVSEISHLLQNNKTIFDTFIQCKNKFLENKEPVLLHSDKDIVKEVFHLREQLESLTSHYDEVKRTEKKYQRIMPIINLIDARTPRGHEDIIRKKINEMLNGI